MKNYNVTTKYYTITYDYESYKTVTINKQDSSDFIVLKKCIDRPGWNIIDFKLSNDYDILDRAKAYSKDVSVLINEGSNQDLIDIFKKHNIRVKMQINFD